MIDLFKVIGELSVNNKICVTDMNTHISYNFEILNIQVLKSFIDLNKDSMLVEEKLLIDYLKNVATLTDAVIIKSSTDSVDTEKYRNINSNNKNSVDIPRINEESCDKRSEHLEDIQNVYENRTTEDYLQKIRSNKVALARQRCYMIINRHIIGRKYGIDIDLLDEMLQLWESKLSLRKYVTSYIEDNKRMARCSYVNKIDKVGVPVFNGIRRENLVADLLSSKEKSILYGTEHSKCKQLKYSGEHLIKYIYLDV